MHIPRLSGLVGMVAVSLVGVAAADASVAASPVVVRPGYQFQPAATVGATYIAYVDAPGFRAHLYVKAAGRRRVRVNARGRAYTGGFDGTTLIYQQVRDRRGGGQSSDIKLYDAVTGTKSLPAGVNTRHFEYRPSMSQNVILFGRLTRRHQKVLLRDETTSTTTLLDQIGPGFYHGILPAQISGDWATWSTSVFSRHSASQLRGNVFRYQLSTHSTERLPHPAGTVQYAPSIGPNGTMFYVRSPLGCGRHVVIHESTPGVGDVGVYLVPRGFDISNTYTVPETGGTYSVYFDKVSCTRDASNIYKLTVS